MHARSHTRRSEGVRASTACRVCLLLETPDPTSPSRNFRVGGADWAATTASDQETAGRETSTGAAASPTDVPVAGSRNIEARTLKCRLEPWTAHHLAV